MTVLSAKLQEVVDTWWCSVQPVVGQMEDGRVSSAVKPEDTFE
jgi:hypothetical protein